MSLLRHVVLAGLCAGLLAVTGLNPPGAREEKKAGKVEVGKPAPNIVLEATQVEKVLPDKKDAKKISLADFKGKNNVVMSFTFAPR
jgi:hypothetical protein